jgi:uncharacterized protein (TIGR02001 family)
LHALLIAIGMSLSCLAVGAASAADLSRKAPAAPAPIALPSPFDFEIGAGVSSDYIFRGIAQSDRKPSVAAHAEGRYNLSDTWQAYAGTAIESIKLTPFGDNPFAEIDVYGGLRGAFGKLSTDVGVWGYLYPGLSTPTPIFASQINWVEVYGKAAYNVTDWLNLGATLFVTPSYLRSGAVGEYVSGTFKATLPYDFALSGEFGRQFLGKTDALHGSFDLPDYNSWNLGLSYMFKAATADIRYYGSDLSKTSCAAITGPTSSVTGTSKYCDTRFVASLSIAFTSKDLK